MDSKTNREDASHLQPVLEKITFGIVIATQDEIHIGFKRLLS